MTMRTTSIDVIQIPTKGPGDVSGLINLIKSGKIEPASILAILGKTEGNGGVNDFTREYAVSALSVALAPYVDLPAQDVEQKIAFVMSGGTEGVLSPHITVFARTAMNVDIPDQGIAGKRLSIGIAHTRNFMPEELGRGAQIDETARAVRAAMADAAIEDPQDVHFVQIKFALLTSDRI
jgi:cyanuric acid amidohydrolase